MAIDTDKRGNARGYECSVCRSRTSSYYRDDIDLWECRRCGHWISSETIEHAQRVTDDEIRALAESDDRRAPICLGALRGRIVDSLGPARCRQIAEAWVRERRVAEAH